MNSIDFMPQTFKNSIGHFCYADDLLMSSLANDLLNHDHENAGLRCVLEFTLLRYLKHPTTDRSASLGNWQIYRNNTS